MNKYLLFLSIILFSCVLSAQCNKKDAQKRNLLDIQKIYSNHEYIYKRLHNEDRNNLRNKIHKDRSLDVWLK